MNKKDKISTLDITLSSIGIEPPSCIDIEEVVLGVILTTKDAIDKIESVLTPEMFYLDKHSKIYKVICDLNTKKGGVIDILTVTERLRANGDLEEIGGPVTISRLTSRVGTDAHIEYHSKLILQYYILRELIIKCSNIERRSYTAEEDVKDLLDELDNHISDLLTIYSQESNTFLSALKQTLQDIKDKSEDKKLTFLKTDNILIDEYIKLNIKTIIYLASVGKHGKSSFIIWLTRLLLDKYQDKLAIQWYTFEEPKEKIVRRFIAQSVDLSDEQLQSIGYKVIEEDQKKINKAIKEFDKYDVEFIEQSCKITNIRSSFKLFCKKRPDKYHILIIDNIGLLTDDKKTQTETDDFIANKIVSIREETEALIFPIHHLVKELADEINLKSGYRPKTKHLKGSTRLLDYCNKVLIINRPSKYKDLMIEENIRWKKPIIKTDSRFDIERFKKEFWSINPKEDSYTNSFTDLFTETWNLLQKIINDKDKEGKPLNKDIDKNLLTVSYLLNKYQSYINNYDARNLGRDEKYKKDKISIYQFLKKKMYNNSYGTTRTARDEYLYGDNEDNCKLITGDSKKDLFIVDLAVNRDGSNEGILRFFANMDHCKFVNFNYSPNI